MGTFAIADGATDGAALDDAAAEAVAVAAADGFALPVPPALLDGLVVDEPHAVTTKSAATASAPVERKMRTKSHLT